MRATRRPIRPKPLIPHGTADMEVGVFRAAAEPMARARITAENYESIKNNTTRRSYPVRFVVPTFSKKGY